VLGGRAPDVLGPRPFWTLADLEFNAVAFAQILDSLSIDRALVKEVFLAASVFDESEAFVYT
jgi:hypothetical protein